jgi:peptidoglycan endopeptidase LytE
MYRGLRYLIVCVIILTFPSLALAAKTHRVKKSETLYSLAKKYHVSVKDLKSANNLVSNQIKGGTLLVIPPRSVVAGSEEKGNVERRTTAYKVRKGDTLKKIAKKTGVSIAELKRLNSLGNARLKPGRMLALQENASADVVPPKVTKRLLLRNSDLFNEKDYEQSLAELTVTSSEKPVDLTKNVDLNVDNIRQLKKTAYGFLGIRYRFGGSSSKGIDCSSFVQQVFHQLDVTLPRTAREQFETGTDVAPGDLQKGDLVFFRTYAPYASHVGIYLGDKKMIHASSRDRRVVISTMNTPYYRSRFLGARRIAKINPEVFKFDDLVAGVEEESADDALMNDTLGVSLNN